MYEHLGDVLKTLCRTGNNEAILVAPFIKRATLARLLIELPDSVRLNCFTRWRPEEVAAGVSDPDIWLDIQQRKGATLWLCPSLHAKYYRIDQTCLIGSANLTDTALQWSATPNLEILCSFNGGEKESQRFERQLQALSVPCQEINYQQIVSTAALLTPDMLPSTSSNALAINLVVETGTPYETFLTPTDLSIWIPRSRQPADLFFAYSGQSSLLTSVSCLAAHGDLSTLQIPLGLPQPLFTRYVATQLLQIPCIFAVDQFVISSQRFGAVRDYLASLPCAKSLDFNATDAWQTLMRWLLYFLPDRYEYSRPRHSEIFRVKAAV